jgi:hypothetical protein
MTSPGAFTLAKTLARGEGDLVQELLSSKELLSLKSIKTSESAAEDQGVDFVRALIGVDRL